MESVRPMKPEKAVRKIKHLKKEAFNKIYKMHKKFYCTGYGDMSLREERDMDVSILLESLDREIAYIKKQVAEYKLIDDPEKEVENG